MRFGASRWDSNPHLPRVRRSNPVLRHVQPRHRSSGSSLCPLCPPSPLCKLFLFPCILSRGANRSPIHNPRRQTRKDLCRGGACPAPSHHTSPGGIIAQGCEVSSPLLVEKYPCSPPSRYLGSTANPGCARSFFRRKPPRNLFAEGTSGPSALLCHSSYSSFRRRRDSNPQPLYEVARAFTTLQILAAGISGPGFFVRCFATELQRLSSLAGIEPTTLGSRCNPSLHHAANSSIFFFPPYFITSLLRLPRTPIASARQLSIAL